ncbi:hypothetical protein E4U09_004601 [Claviceps aff. purpurea]|uniref:Uncharacterized protein n=1 Tax=Claviceps aff. purpurea TaxID=1967640 RepID=A0A9P7QCZ3_9HYPO|nr:hypothetical protein E4U09_004601 [Claviceps aff. purpurea]
MCPWDELLRWKEFLEKPAESTDTFTIVLAMCEVFADQSIRGFIQVFFRCEFEA